MSCENERTANAQRLQELPPRAPKKEKEVFTYDLGLLYHIKIIIILEKSCPLFFLE